MLGLLPQNMPKRSEWRSAQYTTRSTQALALKRSKLLKKASSHLPSYLHSTPQTRVWKASWRSWRKAAPDRQKACSMLQRMLASQDLLSMWQQRRSEQVQVRRLDQFLQSKGNLDFLQAAD